jgi:dipeptidyl aminopeptidase/acylaminoacyl peptidase
VVVCPAQLLSYFKGHSLTRGKMIKKAITILILTLSPLLTQDFLEGVRAEDLMLDRIEPVPEAVAKEIEDESVNYWFGKTLSTAYSHDSSIIAIERTEKPGGKVIGIWLVDSKTKTEKQIVEGITYDLKLSSDGKYLTFTKMVPAKELFHGRQVYEDGGTWLYNVETDKIQPLPPFGTSAAWSAKGNYLAGKYIESEGVGKNTWVLAVYDAENSTTQILDRVIFQDWWNFSWSPNGKMLVYVVATKASGHIDLSPLASEVFIINKNGTGKTQITSTTQPEVLVRWLPDGKSIMVARFKDMPDPETGVGDGEIVVLKLKKKEEK